MRRLQSPIPPDIARENGQRLKLVMSHFKSVLPDLQGLNTWRYQAQISGGIQEYIEAISFQHYLERKSLISHEEAQAYFPNGLVLTQDDYLLGVYDMVGELMRFAITNMATSPRFLKDDLRKSLGDGSKKKKPDLPTDEGSREDIRPAAKESPDHGSREDSVQSLKSSSGDGAKAGSWQTSDLEPASNLKGNFQEHQGDIVTDLRALRTHLESLDTRGATITASVARKMVVMRTCVEKVENASYGMIVRGQEASAR